MCQISTAADALSAVSAGLAWLGDADLTQLTGDEQAACLHALGRAESQALAAKSRVLAVFDAGRGFEADGARSSRSWLRARTRVTGQAAAGSVAWMRRLTAHPQTAAALAAGEISPSWARHVCDWTGGLPAEVGADAEQVLLAAAQGVADLGDLAGLAEEIHRRAARPDTDGDDDGFAERSLRLDEYFKGNGQLAGNLSQRCTAALRAVFESLAGRTGPEDTRTLDQRRHDALEEALERLLAARLVPGRGGQPSVIQLNMDLGQLLGLDGAGQAVADWAGYGATAPPGADCDATIVPVVTGHLDPGLLEQLAAALLRPGTVPGTGAAGAGVTGPGSGGAAWEPALASGRLSTPAQKGRMSYTPAPEPGTAARELILTRATRLLAGPHGLASYLRRSLTSGPAGVVSLPLDIGIPTEIIPPHLRRAVVLRDKHCAFPGCHRPPAGCHVHHVQPRSQGGVTSLQNCILLCPFHHLIAVHRWHWSIRLNPDGTTAATSPDGRKTLHSHSPPQVA
jgi:hypothetical protein